MVIQVEGGCNVEECCLIVYVVVYLLLVKIVFYVLDFNFGCILVVVGYVGVMDFDVNGVNLWFDDVWVVCDGGCNFEYCEEDGQCVMKQVEIIVCIVFGCGDVIVIVWMCDFLYDYVLINVDYCL